MGKVNPSARSMRRGVHASPQGPWTWVMHVPKGAPPQEGWPVMLFLHGSGEAGTDGVAHLRVGLGPVLKQHPERFPGLVLMPQFPVPDPRCASVLGRILEEATAPLPVDLCRVVVTGLSMGGTATWHLGAAFPGRFAALLPICPQARVSLIPALLHENIRCHHGTLDPTVPVSHSRIMIQGLKRSGGNPLYREHPLARHEVWEEVYGDSEAMSWMFQQRRKPPLSPREDGVTLSRG